MTYLLGVLFVAVGVALSIALHEIGHLVPAKRSGVKVTQYMVGFGPTVWSRRRGETEYGVKAIPLGGYIRMIGMFPPKPGADPSLLRSSNTGRWAQLVDQARQDSMEHVAPGDEGRVFYRLPVRRKVLIMLGGPFMNLVIGTVLLGGILTVYGSPQQTTTIATVSQCLHTTTTAQQAAPTTCAVSDPVAPANVAGLRAGDRIVSVDGRPVSRWTDVVPLIRGSASRPLSLVVDRSGVRRTVTLTPLAVDLPKTGADGSAVLDAHGKAVLERVGQVGLAAAVAPVRQPVSAVPGYVGSALGQTAGVVLRIPQKMVGVAQAAFGSGQRDPNGPISVIGIGRVGGEVAAGQLGIAGGTAAKIVTLLLVLASLNFALFVFNLIPLLPLDGGHVAGALWEGVKRSVARLRGRRDPGYVDVAKGLPVAYAVASMLLVMSALLMYADIVRPVRL